MGGGEGRKHNRKKPFNNSVDTGHSHGIYKVWHPLGMTANRREQHKVRTSCEKIMISNGVKEQRGTHAKLPASNKAHLLTVG